MLGRTDAELHRIAMAMTKCSCFYMFLSCRIALGFCCFLRKERVAAGPNSILSLADPYSQPGGPSGREVPLDLVQPVEHVENMLNFQGNMIRHVENYIKLCCFIMILIPATRLVCLLRTFQH